MRPDRVVARKASVSTLKKTAVHRVRDPSGRYGERGRAHGLAHQQTPEDVPFPHLGSFGETRLPVSFQLKSLGQALRRDPAHLCSRRSAGQSGTS